MKWLLPFSLSLNVLFMTVSCGHNPMHGKPTWNGAIWSGSSAIGGFRRTQAGQEMSCLTPKIDNYAAVSYGDLQCLFDLYVQNCREFKNPNLTCKSNGRDARSFVRNTF